MRGFLRFMVWCLLAVVLFVVCSVALAFAFYWGGQRASFWGKYQQVRLDMTKEQVEAILGPPADEECWGMGSLSTGWLENGQRINVDYGCDSEGESVIRKSFHVKPGWKPWWQWWRPAPVSEELELVDEFPAK